MRINLVTAISALLSLGAFNALTHAQPIDEQTITNATAISPSSLHSDSFAPSTYSQRGLPAYHVGIPDLTGGSWATSSATAYDDVSFAFACPQLEPVVVITGIALGFNKVSLNTSDRLYTRLSFYPNHDPSDGALTPYSGTPVTGVIDWGPGWSHYHSGVLYVADPVALAPPFIRLDSSIFTDGPGDSTCGVKVELFLDAALTIRGSTEGWQIARRLNHTSFISGSSDTFAWYDMSTPTGGEVLNTHRSGGGALGVNSRATYMALSNGVLDHCNLPCSSDFDHDGDFGTNADIEAFFACLAGTCCPTCDRFGSDFNRDGDFGTDADIEAFFRVLAGGNC